MIKKKYGCARTSASIVRLWRIVSTVEHDIKRRMHIKALADRRRPEQWDRRLKRGLTLNGIRGISSPHFERVVSSLNIVWSINRIYRLHYSIGRCVTRRESTWVACNDHVLPHHAKSTLRDAPDPFDTKLNHSPHPNLGHSPLINNPPNSSLYPAFSQSQPC